MSKCHGLFARTAARSSALCAPGSRSAHRFDRPQASWAETRTPSSSHRSQYSQASSSNWSQPFAAQPWSGSSWSQTSDLSTASTTSTASTSSGSSSNTPIPPSPEAVPTETSPQPHPIAHKHERERYAFDHGAYGIPKRHPWAASASATPRTGAVGMLAAAADFLTGSASETEPLHKKDKLGGEIHTSKDGTPLGLNSPIRAHGRIVQDRLESVQVGEDAYFLRADALGVADGVGGWASRAGADPALFSRLLMHFCAAELGKFDDLSANELSDGGHLSEWESVDPVEVVHTAWERCVRASRREGILGSSTALVAVLRGSELRICNVGDCVVLIIRDGQLVFRSSEQQHSFNYPVQLGMMGYTAESVTLAARRTLALDGYLRSGAADDLEAGTDPKVEGEDADWDEPRRDAGRWTISVEPGDIVIVASDGLVDNLFDEDIVEEVARFGDNFRAQEVCEALCSRAKAVSSDARAVSSPFAQRAMEEGLHYVGGKHDDITVVVAVVVAIS